jgi:hypothetical protein
MLKNFRTATMILLVVGVIVALSPASFAQKVTLPKYDAKTEVHLVKAVVQDVKEMPVGNGQRVVLNVKAGEDTFDVYLSPKSYLDLIDSAFAKGDEIEITGSKVTDSENKTVILAREVVKGQNTVELRDKNGEPAWTWMEKSKTAEGK